MPPLPNLPAGPLPPSPPTSTDVANAVTYNAQLLSSDDLADPSLIELGERAAYEAAVTAELAGPTVAPEWFAPAFAASVGPILASLANLERKVDTLTRTAIIAYNSRCGDGRARPFLVVPFNDGTLPTAAPYNLPHLVDLTAINALTGEQATLYLVGYQYPHPIPSSIVELKKAVQIEIGCRASFS